MNLPKMRLGGVDCSFFHVDVSRAWKNHLTYALDAIGFLSAEIGANYDWIRLARTTEDIIEAKRDGLLSAILAVENSDACEGSLHVLWALYQLGVRSMGLTHNLRSDAADGCAEDRTKGGLTRFGVALVLEMNRLGMIVDVSHLSERGFFDVLEVAQKPLLASRSCCRALCDHPRNLRDEQIRALAGQGGCIGVTFVPAFVHETAPDLDRLADHFEHIAALAGPGCLGIGSDFDGGGDLLRDATALASLTRKLAERGFSTADLQQILGLNHLRVMRENLG